MTTHELADRSAKVLLAKTYDAVEALRFDGEHEALGVLIEIWALGWQLNRTHAIVR